MEIKLSFKEYGLLERSLRGDATLSSRLCENLPISKNQLIMELLEEIRDFEYDEDGQTPLEYRIYEEGRALLEAITERIYPNEGKRYFNYLEGKGLVHLDNVEKDIMITIKI